jgi:hypothetical protein
MLEPGGWDTHDPEEAPAPEWQIDRIDPAQGVNPRTLYGVPALLALALLLVGVLAATLLAPVVAAAGEETPFFSLLTPAHLFMLALGLLCAIPLALGLIATVRRLVTPAPWVEVEALCYRRDIQPVPASAEASAVIGASLGAYSYRLLCRFEHNDQIYEVTPEGLTEPDPRRFDTPQGALEFLKGHLAPDGRTRLWVNARNPLDARLTAPPR